MGNCFSLHGRRRRRYIKSRHRRLEATNTHYMMNEGIKTVEVEELCDSTDKPILCMCILTWNMNGKVSSDLEVLIGGNQKFDLFVVGLQEVPRRNMARLLQKVLVDTHRLLGAAIMQSLQLFVFGPKNSELSAKDILIEKHAVGGLGGLIGRKKGAVAISFSFKGIRMEFINCHLSAHASNVEERNAQCRRISHSFMSKKSPYARPSHITVWLGDLNYRIQGIDTLPVRSLIQRNLLKMLTSKDQLRQEAERGQVFNGYCEGDLAFNPTYKYNIGSSNYDTSYKVRVPSWTDRILFKIEKSDNIEAALHSYESIDHINTSDHKPVRAHLCLKLKKPR
ncbi:type IV inositol polyphosphate 5-phosphatase 11 [Cinnamomum micranthum f. kanehirae]|uniref:Type IV inositol polyphosphate 5-phosphatase 11 n=1 Tax=Cinnamomum micranthum f. kanehirae TaxID=337451 RepID=A0A3S3N7N5_9MAGN|nr:type IV inositol polyphosphate 5-phosphatase 11 [Cinnamomum micranthum f. kanehirae]